MAIYTELREQALNIFNEKHVFYLSTMIAMKKKVPICNEAAYKRVFDCLFE